jgi:hypothetical protein
MHGVDGLITEFWYSFAALAGLSLLWTRVYRDKGQGAIPNSNSLHTKVFLRFLTLVSPHPPDSTNEKADVTAQLLGLHMTGSSHSRCAQLSCVATLEIMRADPPRSLRRATSGTHARKKKIPIARSRSGNKHVVKPEPLSAVIARPTQVVAGTKKLDMSSLSVGSPWSAIYEPASRKPPSGGHPLREPIWCASRG